MFVFSDSRGGYVVELHRPDGWAWQRPAGIQSQGAQGRQSHWEEWERFHRIRGLLGPGPGLGHGEKLLEDADFHFQAF